MIQMFTKKRKGFTLIELIVVVAILGILAALAIPRLTGAQARAKVSADKATFATLNSAIAIGIAEGNIGDCVLTVSSAETTGILSIAANPTTALKEGFMLIESGAALKVEGNIGKGFVWTISGGAISKAPTINDGGEITNPS